MDFFLSIYLLFFFSLLPNYFADNPQLKELQATRNVLNKNKSINDLTVLFTQVFFLIINVLF